jgi:hypothetical protein
MIGLSPGRAECGSILVLRIVKSSGHSLKLLMVDINDMARPEDAQHYIGIGLSRNPCTNEFPSPAGEMRRDCSGGRAS